MLQIWRGDCLGWRYSILEKQNYEKNETQN